MRLPLLLLLLPVISYGQFTDDFSDGDFSQPAWTGDTSAFIVSNGMLQLQSAGSATSSLFYSRNSPGHQEHEWSFRLKMDFSPSSQNFARYYFYADQADPALMQTALYLQLGESGSNDAAELKMISNGTTILISRGVNGLIAVASDLVYTLQCDSNFYWSLWTEDNSGNKILQFSAQQQILQNGIYGGWQCTYTSSNSDNFYLDDVYDAALRYDTLPPQLLSAEAINPDSITVTWNEAVSLGNAVILLNGTTCSFNTTGNNSIVLFNFPGLQSGNINSVFAMNVSDIYGNTNPADTVHFTYIYAAPASGNEIRINEIMADPQGANTLPEAEYLELINTSGSYLILDSLRLTDGTSTATINGDTIQPYGFLVFSSTTAATLLRHSGINAIGVSNFPSLNNSGDTIRLINRPGNIIEEVIYNEETYQNALKAGGGWSLEKIDAQFPCESTANWSASGDFAGGTPGRKNSMEGEFSDDVSPCIDYATMPDSMHILIVFNESMDPSTLTNSLYYTISGKNTSVTSITLLNANTVLTELSAGLLMSEIITITLDQRISDCSGNSLGNCNVVQAGLSKGPLKGDILINEVLFNSYDGTADFIEIVNNSSAIIALDSIRLARRNEEGDPDDLITVKTKGRCILPQQIIVFSDSPEQVTRDYPLCNKSRILMQGIPPLNNDEGDICVLDPLLNVLDEFHYSEDRHFPLLSSVKGVSLERISLIAPSDDSLNWHSASGVCGFASPGNPNSQSADPSGGGGLLELNYSLFSPDNDGEKDILPLTLKFDNNGYMVRIRIYDSNGLPVRELAANDLAGLTSVYNWDGFNDVHTLCEPGIYIVLVEAVHPAGHRKMAKKSCVLVSRF